MLIVAEELKSPFAGPSGPRHPLRTVRANIQRGQVNETDMNMRKNSAKDVKLGHTAGQLLDLDLVSRQVCSDQWLLMPRFFVVQGLINREVDDGSATSSEAILASSRQRSAHRTIFLACHSCWTDLCPAGVVIFIIIIRLQPPFCDSCKESDDFPW